jgi:hypothetical protein
MLAGEVQKGIEILDRLEIDVASVSSVAAVGAALGNEFFPAKTDAAVAPVSRLHPDLCLVDEHRFISRSLGIPA